MRVAHFLGGILPRHTDYEDLKVLVEDHGVWLRHMTEHLARRGHEIMMCLFYPRSGTVHLNGVEWRFYRPLLLPRILRDGKEWNPLLCRDLLRWGPQIIHFHILTYDANLFATSFLCRLLRIPFLAHHHGEPIPRPTKRLRRRLIRLGLRQAKTVLFLTEEDRARWKSWTSIRHARIVPTGYSSEFTPGNREEARGRTGLTGDPLVLWVGYLRQSKNPLMVLQGFRLFSERFPGARLHMVGDGSLRGAVEQAVRADPLLGERVVCHGALPQRRLPDFYRSADLFVLGSWFEGLGAVCLEAMACGAVPVVTDVSGFRAATDEGRYGILYPPGDSEALAAALEGLARDPARREAMARSALHWVQRFLWDRIAESLEGLYAELLEDRPANAQSRSGASGIRT